jgi:hypothetical protein
MRDVSVENALEGNLFQLIKASPLPQRAMPLSSPLLFQHVR